MILSATNTGSIENSMYLSVFFILIPSCCIVQNSAVSVLSCSQNIYVSFLILLYMMIPIPTRNRKAKSFVRIQVHTIFSPPNLRSYSWGIALVCALCGLPICDRTSRRCELRGTYLFSCSCMLTSCLGAASHYY